MREFEIVHLETGKVLRTVYADELYVNENGVATFLDKDRDYLSRMTALSKAAVASTQVSSSILIQEKKAPAPVLVVNSKE